MPLIMLPPFDFKQWIESHRHLLKPPVGNRLLFPVDDFVIMIVGGPNARSDFHVDPGQELFHQIEGDMLLKTIQDGKVVDIPIRQGEMFLLPANMPHSPQRFPDTVGLVIERRRLSGEQDGLQWYCERCNHRLFEEFFELTNIETQFPPVFQRFYDSLAHRTCPRCGTVAPVPESRRKSG
jgi:3-hydroxyanthranilate 3,4-dioxygenase